MTFGEYLRKLRHERGWTLMDVASKANCHFVAVSRIETGYNEPSMRMLENLAAAFGVNPYVEWWTNGRDETEAPKVRRLRRRA